MSSSARTLRSSGLGLAFSVLGAAWGMGCSDDTTPSPGASGGATSAGAGGASTGVAGAAGTSATAGASAGMAGANGGAGSGGANAGGTAGAGGMSGAGGSAGQDGASAKPEAELDGASWIMECTEAREGNLCAVMPPGQNTCPAVGYTSIDKTLKFGGTPGTVYDVTIHFQGTHEAGDYTGGTAGPPQFLRDATRTEGGLHTWLWMEVSAPAATYFPNAGGGGGSVQVYDYMATIPIEGGATIKLKGFDIDCLMHRYCQDNQTSPCKGLVVGDISPANAPIDGAFLHMSVTSVVAR